jgi:hypothetical protein
MRHSTLNKRKNRKQDFGRRFEKLEDRLLLAGDMEFRSFDGSGNNLNNGDWGAANQQLVRLTTVEYGPGSAGAFPALATRVDSNGDTINPRTVSNLLFDQDADESKLNDRGLTSFTFQWGQFLDHDMDLTEDFPPVGSFAPEDLLPGEDISFLVPTDGTESELPIGTIIPQLRSRFELDEHGIAQQINQITAYIDASNVYGSDAEKAEGLRAHYAGMLLTSNGEAEEGNVGGEGRFLPFNYEFNGEYLENAAPPPLDQYEYFVSGDVRSNEQPGLTTMHTLFVLEHNYQARRIADRLGLDADDLAEPEIDEHVYQLARAIVTAEVQSITYNEFLPALFGPDQLASYRGYQDDLNAGIANVFSASLYRVGHTMLPNELLLLNADGSPVADDPDVLGASVINGELALGEAFFNPELITQFGIEPYLKGLATQQIQEIDNLIVDGVRNLLFDPPAGFDLGATNLQRGRDHGLADYNQTRLDFGLTAMTDFSQISSDPDVAAALATAYDGDINNIDVFAAAISEDQIAGGSVGELLHTVLVDQFTRLRDGDRFYYENQFHGRELADIQNTRLSDIIRRNTDLQDVQDEVFRSENVFTFRAEEGRGSMNVTLRVQGDELQVTKGSGNRVIASKTLDDTDIVVIYGTSKNDRIRVDASVAELFAGSVEVHGGGKFDRLVVKAADQIVVAPTEIRVNDLSVFYGNIEKVEVQAQRPDRNRGRLLNVNPTLASGLGNDVLVATAATDRLSHGRGRDLGVGGRQVLFGNSADDTSPAGEASADLVAVQNAGRIASSDASRVAEMRDNIASDQNGARDLLFRRLGQDWFLPNSLEVALDGLSGEVVN